MTTPGNPADLPDYDAPGEEWFASGGPEAPDTDAGPVRFETATGARPASSGVKWFVAVILGLFAVGIVALIVAMVTTVGR